MTNKFGPKPFRPASMYPKAGAKAPSRKPKPPKVKKRQWLEDLKPAFNTPPTGVAELEAQLKDKRPLPLKITDPVRHVARQEEKFHASQAATGLGILSNGLGIDTAADAQNVEVARQEFNWQLPEEPAPPPTTEPMKPETPDPYLDQGPGQPDSYSQPLQTEKFWWESAGINADHLNEANLGPDLLHGDPMGFGKKMP